MARDEYAAKGRSTRSLAHLRAKAHGQTSSRPTPKGRWPANVVLDESQAEALDEQSGTS
jgi:hypothetical protein